MVQPFQGATKLAIATSYDTAVWLFGIHPGDLVQVQKEAWVRTFITALFGTWRVTGNLGVHSWGNREA